MQAEQSFFESGIHEVCSLFPARSAGSESETRCQAHFAAQLSQWADTVRTEGFAVHPKAFLGWLVAAGALGIGAVTAFWLQMFWFSPVLPALGAVAVFLALAMFVFEFIFYRRFVDFLFPRARSHNVYAVRHAQNAPRRRIIFGGHADAAYEMTYCSHGGKKVLYSVMIGASAGLGVTLVCSVALVIRTVVSGGPAVGGVWDVLAALQLCFVPFFAAILFFVNWRCVVDGANDNLSACFAAMGILRRMAQADVRLKNTEVCCLITGAEESGLRGALAFAARHRQALRQTETIFIAMDTLRETPQLMAYLSGQSGTQKNDARVGNLLRHAAENCGIQLGIAPFYPGATDAEGFSRNGLPACGLCAVRHDPQPYYHTRRDSWDNIDASCIETAMLLCLEAARLYDASAGIDTFS